MCKKIVTLSLLSALLLSNVAVMSCGKTQSDKEETSVEYSSSETVDELPKANYNGYKFRILNFDTYFSQYVTLDFDEYTGDKLDDAVYDRNRKVEAALNFELEEITMAFNNNWGVDQVALIDRLVNSVMADDDEFDAAYIQPTFKPAILTDGTLVDLKSISELKLDEIWWDNNLNDSFTFDGKLYVATGALQLMPIDSVWVLFFNETKFDAQNLEYPYQLVRDGKWTVDKFYEYAQQCTLLNSDENFNWKADGTSVYGIAGHTSLPVYLILSSDYNFVEEKNGEYEIQLSSEQLMNRIDKIVKLFDTSSGLIHCNNETSGNPEGYTAMFRNGRAAFLTTNLSVASEYRDMEDSFGLLPFPKYDEEQENYISMATNGLQMLGIPITSDDLSRTGTIIEALTYESYQSVLPNYYGVRLEQKGLRNEDSIEMLQIIRDNYGADFMSVTGVASEYISQLNSKIQNSQTDIVSLAVSNETMVKEKLDTLLEEYRK